MKNRVDIYTRLSDEDRYKRNKEDDSESIANQKSMLLKYALNHGWEVINVYSDDDYSGAEFNRPQFQKMLEDCEKGLVDIVLCKTQSRFSRDMEIIERYIHNKFVEWGVRFVSVVDNADTEVEGNKKSRQINGLVNEWYLEDLSNNIRSSLQNKREEGQYLGSFAPYGYLKDPNNKNKLIIDPIASEVVKVIFDLYKSGVGYYNIAVHLNEKRIMPPTLYKQSMGSKYVCKHATLESSIKWHQDTIARMLRNEVYIGNLVQGKRTHISYKNHKQITKPESEWTRSYGTHEPIIDIETWNFIQSKFKSRVRSCSTTGDIYILSKKVYCKECKQIFSRQLYNTKEGKTPYLKCKGRKRTSIGCENNSSIRCEVIEKIILDELNKQLDLYYDINELERLYAQNNKKSVYLKKESYLIEKKNLTQKLEKKNNYYKQLYEDKLDGIISQEEFIMLREKYNREKEEINKRLKIIEFELVKIENKEINKMTSKNIFEKYRHLNKLNREIIEEFIDIIWIGKLERETNSRDINIELNIIKNSTLPC